MKSGLLITGMIAFFPWALSAQWNVDTTVNGITVSYDYSPAIFPDTWRIKPINAQAEKIVTSEVERTKSIISRAFSKYPAELLKDNLRAVYFVKSMKFYNVGYGGTNSSDAIYLTDGGFLHGYTDSYLEQTFHHEFSSILFRNFITFIDTIAWTKANEKDFRYYDPDNGVGAIKKHRSSQVINLTLCNKGFLTEYAMSSIENDLNTVAQQLFLPSKNFWKIADTCPRIRMKTQLLINFYNTLNPLFTESYFRKLNSAL
jgi:hypothetical protein